jgi:hypothetical protein
MELQSMVEFNSVLNRRYPWPTPRKSFLRFQPPLGAQVGIAGHFGHAQTDR